MIRLCNKCGSELESQGIGWKCNNCGIFIDMQGNEHIPKETPFVPPLSSFYVVSENDYNGGYGAMYYIVYASQDWDKIVEFCKNRYKNDFIETHDYINDTSNYKDFYICRIFIDIPVREFVGGYTE